MSWSLRRKMLYAGVSTLLLVALVAWVGVSVLSKPATCFDGIQNEGETGIDCGGPCAQLCSDQTHAPVVLWSRAFETSSTTYTAAAYVQNTNTGASARQVPYAFRLFDANNLLITERDGVLDIPPQLVVPVVEPNINVGNRTVATTFFEFSANPSWSKIESSALPSVHLTDEVIAPDASRLTVTVENTGNSDVINLPLTAVLFDQNGTAQAASRSVIDRIPAGGSQQVVFTWPGGVPNTVRFEITPVPVLPAQ